MDKSDKEIFLSRASIIKAQSVINYIPQFDVSKGLNIACDWYWDNLG